MDERLRAIFSDAHAGALPPVRGAYLLSITLTRTLAGSLRGKSWWLGPGTYLYAGSANGPGGIAARVARHVRRDKPQHWHVDALTAAASETNALAFPGGDECALVERLQGEGYHFPVPGFGSSDCRSCPAHLLGVSTAGGNPLAAG